MYININNVHTNSKFSVNDMWLCDITFFMYKTSVGWICKWPVENILYNTFYAQNSL